MKRFNTALFAFVAILSISSFAFAGGNELSYKKIQSLGSFSGAPADGDYLYIYDGTDTNGKKIDARDVSINSTFGTDVDANAAVKAHVVTDTIAEINAGHVLLASQSGTTIYVHDVIAYSSGNMGGLTNVVLEDTAGTDIVTFSSGALTDGTVVNLDDSGVTLSTGFVDGLASEEGLQVSKTGGTGSGSTQVNFSILYSVQ